MRRGLSFWVVVAVFVITLALALGQRYGLMDFVQLGPSVANQGSSLSALGGVGGTLPGADACCLCAHDKQWPGASGECDLWLEAHKSECVVSKKVEYDSHSSTCWQSLSCDSLLSTNECKGKRLLFETYGHSSSDKCKPFADFVFKVCVNSGVSCAEVVNNGCSTFANVFEAYAYIGSLSEACPGVKVSITGNQCVAFADDGNNKRCLTYPWTISSCTISVSADCASCTFASCNFGDKCTSSGSGSFAHCGSAYCEDIDGSLVKKICCDVEGKSLWAREGTCPVCEGSCCGAEGRCHEGDDFFIIRQFFDKFGSDKNLCETVYEGRWNEGVSCSQNACPALNESTGSCCLASKNSPFTSCINLMTEQECDALDDFDSSLKSIWNFNSSCIKVNQCKGACCITYEDGSKRCLQSSELYCDSQRTLPGVVSASWGSGKSCDSFCASEEGACCTAEGFCHANSDIDWCESQSGTLYPQISCDSLDFCGASGKCCIEYKDGTKECRDALTYSQCQSIKSTPYEDKDVVDVRWFQSALCADGECFEVKGACCEIDICNQTLKCMDDLTYQQCAFKQQSSNGCVQTQWSAEKRCSEVHCAKEGCRADFPEAYVGPSCNECKRNFCSLYDLLNGGCPSWCSQYPDDFGNYCCGVL